ncbi:putative type I restriction-modification system specificity subunit S [Bifidobacterium minimum]|uniref:Putative type I restriction-modification system specificity subunit S n=1 Tax=Bifidobacterium minimum TaxID=1693 RepID=A0A087BQL1_9BIFI|nr:restriction endonuclease subunit S [Bifidobacterium minimum]KFI73311.1 putative type I restriction-modification system specificity subunit S [Bifidobacterium minimum]
MSRIDNLIQELCPDGVEFRTISEVAQVSTGNSDRKDATPDGKYPFYVRSKSIQRSDTYEFDETAIVIPGEGGIGDIFHYVEGKYALHQRAYRIHFINQHISTKFAYYYFSVKFKEFILKKAVSATVISIRKPMIESFRVPVPPLAVQEEIVRILDSFTSLEAELEAELEARRKQYEYYRNKLLSADGQGDSRVDDLIQKLCPDGVDYKSVIELFDLRNGYTPSKSNPAYWNGRGTIPWFRMEDIRANGGVLNHALQQIPEIAVKGGKLFPANSLLVATSATIGEHALVTVPHLSNQRFTSLALKPRYQHMIDMKYMYYYGFILDDWCRNNVTTSSFASVDMAGFKHFRVPIPALPVQEEIVRILDKFNSLVSDLSSGLPAEIAARRQQYEFYRDRLLSFKELGV